MHIRRPEILLKGIYLMGKHGQTLYFGMICDHIHKKNAIILDIYSEG